MLEGLTPPDKFKGTCKVATVAAALSDKDRDILMSAVMDSENWPVKSLSKALSGKGLQISDTPLYSHRNRACSCFRG